MYIVLEVGKCRIPLLNNSTEFLSMLYYELVNDNTIYNGLNSQIIKWHLSDAAELIKASFQIGFRLWDASSTCTQPNSQSPTVSNCTHKACSNIDTLFINV